MFANRCQSNHNFKEFNCQFIFKWERIIFFFPMILLLFSEHPKLLFNFQLWATPPPFYPSCIWHWWTRLWARSKIKCFSAWSFVSTFIIFVSFPVWMHKPWDYCEIWNRPFWERTIWCSTEGKAQLLLIQSMMAEFHLAHSV